MPASRTTAASAPKPAGLGTFAGVFTPSLLTILGLILFRRLGWIVGEAGPWRMVVLLGVAHLLSLITSTSLAALATNVRVKGGGDYYIISRSLGVGVGGALGLVLFLAQAVSVAFYCLGLGEALALITPPAWGLDGPQIAAASVLLLFVFAWAGSDWATKLQYLVMAALVVALTSFFLGAAERFDPALLHAAAEAPARSDGVSLGVLFALFFPAVTGFTQGVSMSGDLRDPSKSLPTGTFAAVIVSLLVYGAASFALAGSLGPEGLTSDYEAMTRLARWPEVVTVGVVAATLSSALASFMGAPRILQALAADRILPGLSPFARGFGAANNPRMGVLLTLGVALGVVSLGGVDAIAPIVSMCFLLSYGLLNGATALEARANSPSFRPRFRAFHWTTSAVGALLCLGAMLLIDWQAGLISMGVLAVLHQAVSRGSGDRRWADGRRDLHYDRLRRHLIAMAREPEHARNWRPHTLVFSERDAGRVPLLRFAEWIEGGAGLNTVVKLVQLDARADTHREQGRMATELREHGLDAFPLVVATDDMSTTCATLVQAHGLGPVRTNTILLPWSERADACSDAPATGQLLRHLQTAARLGVHVLVLDAQDADWQRVADRKAKRRRLDLWWSDDPNGELMLLLSHMMRRDALWRRAKLRVLLPTNPRAEADARARVATILDEARLDAEIVTTNHSDPEQLAASSADADLVLMPLRLKGEQAVDLLGRPVEALLDKLGAVVLVSASEGSTLSADPERGGPADRAARRDELRGLEKRLARLEAELEEARPKLEPLRTVAQHALAHLDELKQSASGERELTRQQTVVDESFNKAALSERGLRRLEAEREELHSRRRRIESELLELDPGSG
ncbi:MAG: Na-K-Cl cotransporter [Planctomycetota bacterium]|nr:MAG: Na-K-Cl cotransporter [Planctomycetota bacterium]